MKVRRTLKFSFSSLLLFLVSSAFSQTTGNYSLVDNLNQVTPTMHQFTKYTDLPVSEYTGIPNVSIPLYEIDEDGVKVPIGLSYHASGIKVNEEASWVGLGWDMTIGSIVQQINDQDDYAVSHHLESDYVNSGTPQLFPFKYTYCSLAGPDGPCQYGCSGLLPVAPVIAADGIEVYTAQWAPFAGNYNLQDYQNYFDDHFYYSLDSEPDIFTANFLGHSIKFIRDMNSGQIVVLNKKGYLVSRTGNVWKIIVPTGEEYDFAVEDNVQSVSTSTSITGASYTSPLRASSNIWMLSQIITKNKKVITFNYTQTPVKPCYPSFTQRGSVPTLAGTYAGPPESFCMSTDITNNICQTGVFNNYSFSYEQYSYLSSIVFPNGTVNFNLSARNDIKGGLKLDSLAVSTTQQVKSVKFNYSYFNATSVGGNTISFTDTTNFANYPLYRLQLLSIQDNSGAKHTFTYNSTPLPAKNSFAVDYWGYYNGDLSNTTFVPNATQFNQTGWLTNSDNHSANITYTQAGILQQIVYPTGGTVNFTYQLNQFSNYWVPDYSSSTNTVSSGDGLRIQAVTWQDASSNQLKKTTYSYAGGMASIPINFFRNYSYSVTSPNTVYVNSGGVIEKTYSIKETNMSGAYTANPFASFNGVGYSQVIKSDVNNNGVADGKTVSSYYNQPDLVYNSITAAQQSDPTLPAFKNPLDTADNGSLKSALYYDSNNNLLKKVTNTYTNINSPFYYGARIMGYGSYFVFGGPSGVSPYPYSSTAYPMNMVCYYPIFDFESLLSSSAETDYFAANAVATTTNNTYDQYNQLVQTTKTNSTYSKTTGFSYPYAYPNNTVLSAMTSANRLSDIVSVTIGTPGSGTHLNRSYRQLGSLYVANNDTSYIQLAYAPEVTSYDQYDSSNGNILQYSKNGIPNSFIWDYNKEYVIAGAKNALYKNIAYTSFEADGTGRWKFTGLTTPDPTAPTGEKVYSLGNGNIYRDSLDATQTYIVSYWSKSGAQSVSGSTATKQGYTFNGYTYYESTVLTPSGGTITVSGTGTIDELRLYPNTAQMTSYTYAPLVGITSESSAGGKIAYYEYDNAMRLLDIRDQNNNILKAFCYNYAGQPTTCGLDISYSSQPLSQNFTRNCSGGYVGSSIPYSIPSGKYTSTMSLADANNQAQEDMTANGQANANTNGVCIIPPTISNVGYGGHGTGYTMVVFSTIPNCSTAIVSYVDQTTLQGNSSAGACTSPQFVTVPIIGHTYKFTVTCYSSGFPSGITSLPFFYTALN